VPPEWSDVKLERLFNPRIMVYPDYKHGLKRGITGTFADSGEIQPLSPGNSG
jgi:hypothetical protein